MGRKCIKDAGLFDATGSAPFGGDALADLLLVDSDPRHDLSLLNDRARSVLNVKNGATRKYETDAARHELAAA